MKIFSIFSFFHIDKMYRKLKCDEYRLGVRYVEAFFVVWIVEIGTNKIRIVRMRCGPNGIV